MKQIILFLSLLILPLWATEGIQNKFYEYPLHDFSQGHRSDTLLWQVIQKEFRIKSNVSTNSPENDITAFKEKKYNLYDIASPTMHQNIFGIAGFFNGFTSNSGAQFVLLFQIEDLNNGNPLKTDYIWAPIDFYSKGNSIKCDLQTKTPLSFSVSQGDKLLNNKYNIKSTSELTLFGISLIPKRLIFISRANSADISKEFNSHVTELQNILTPEECQTIEKQFSQQHITPLTNEEYTSTVQSLNSNNTKVVALNKRIQGSIYFQANIFQALIKDDMAIDYNTKIIPATGGFSIGNDKVQFFSGAGAYRTNLAIAVDSLTTQIDTPQSLIKKVFNLNFGVRNTIYENKRFCLTYLNLFAIHSIKEEYIHVEISNYLVDYSINNTRTTNIEVFSGFEPHFKIANRFSLFTRSGLSLLWLDQERNSFRIAPRALYGGVGMSFNF